MWYNNLYFQYFLALYKVHHVEIVENGLLTFDQDGKSCSILLQTNVENYLCNWQLNETSVFDSQFVPIDPTNEYLSSYDGWIKRGYSSEEYIEAKFDITKFANNPRQWIYWLENIGPKSHGIVNVSCEIEVAKVLSCMEDILSYLF